MIMNFLVLGSRSNFFIEMLLSLLLLSELIPLFFIFSRLKLNSKCWYDEGGHPVPQQLPHNPINIVFFFEKSCICGAS